MVAGGAAPAQGFRARAGVLTLMLATSALDRKRLLAILDQVVSGVEDPDVGKADEEEVFWAMVNEEFLIEVADESKLRPDGSIGPDTPLRASPAGRELMLVGMALRQWLAARPDDPLELGGVACGEAMAALIGGLATTVLHRIGCAPLSVEEACEAVSGVPDAAVEARIEAMRQEGLVEPILDDDGETRYELTRWGREAIVPVVAAGRFEDRHPRGDTMPPDRLDVEAAFAFSLPLLELDPSLSGSCRLAVGLAEEAGGQPTGVLAHLEAGGVSFVETGRDDVGHGTPAAAASAWMQELVAGDPRVSEVAGEDELAREVVEAMRAQLFAAAPSF